MKYKNSHESGRSMVEMLGVLAIIGVLSVGGIAGYSMAMSKFKITKAMDQVQTILTNIRTLYASQRKYTALTPKTAYNMGILTDETFEATGSTGLNPFGGEIKFGVGGTGRSFTVEYTGLTKEACLKLATADWGADQSSGLMGITVGGTAHTWASGGLPVDLATAATNCETAQTVKWEYR